MSQLPHFRLEGMEKAENYSYPDVVVGKPFKRPARDQPAHATKLKAGLGRIGRDVNARREAEAAAHPELVRFCAEGVILTFRSEAGHELTLDKFDRARAGVELVGVNVVGGVQIARVFVPTGEERAFLKLVEEYAASKVLTYHADPKDEAELVALAEPGNGAKVRRPVRRKKVEGEDKVVVTFVVAADRLDAFKAKAGGLADLAAESRRHVDLIDSVSSVRLAVVEDFWQERAAFPPKDKELWWEVWLIGSRRTAAADHRRFVEVAELVGISRVSDVYVAFPERVVVHAWATGEQLSAVDVLAMVGELRAGKELATVYADMPGREQRAFIDDALTKLTPADPAGTPCVCVLDGGVNRPHPLLSHSLAESDLHAPIPEWGKADHRPDQHGTGMAGIALYGCLTELMTATQPIRLRHILESVKIMPPTGANAPPDYARRMQDGVALAQIQAPRRNRALSMAVTYLDYKNGGLPSLWSAGVDDLCFGLHGGPKALMFVSAGNLRDEILEADFAYPDWNMTRGGGVEDPGQAWNAVTVGAYTERVMLTHPGLRGYSPVAGCGDLCPTSRTSLAWPDGMRDDWPVKPDIVMEGGNYARQDGAPMSCDDLSLLTTTMRLDRLLTTTRDTSPATALAARMAARIWSHHPKLRPETVRALMIHSAEWTPAMVERFRGAAKNVALRCLRCYGYGVPDLERALHSARDAVTMVYEGGLTPFRLDGGEVKTNHMNVHPLPWPVEALESLGEEEVTMRVTLSYFIEPSPGSVPSTVRNRYASHGLRFDVIRPTESGDQFMKRVSKSFWSGPSVRPKNERETRPWRIGEDNRTLGSVHSDWWTGTAATLARSGRVVVYPVAGWWKERKHLGRYDGEARYSLIVSIRSRRRDLDLYSLVENVGVVKTEVLV